MAPPSIHYVSHFWCSGYGTAARRLFLALDDLGVPLKWSPIEFREHNPLLSEDQPTVTGLDDFRSVEMEADVLVIHSVPEIAPHLRHLQPRSAVVLHTVWEHEALQPHWPELINACDGVIVPTHWNAKAFRRAGVTIPIEVVPHVASTDAADTAWLQQPPISTGDAFLVHSIAEWSIRKTPWLSLEAFARAFDNDGALMVMRTNAYANGDTPFPPGPPDKRQLTSWWTADLLHRHHPTSRVNLVSQTRSDEEIQGLHRRSNCWISLPHAEGWNLGAFDAAAAGATVITTAFGGPLEYLDPEASFLIPGTISIHPTMPEMQWLDPDLDAAVSALREIRHDAEHRRALAAAQGERIRRTYAPEVVAGQFLRALERMRL